MTAVIVRPMPGTTPRTGLPGFRPYVYRGGGTDTLTPPGLQALLDEQFGPDELPWPCGTPLGYGRGCRCRWCTGAENARKREWKQRRAAS